jgi:type IV pilus assembly protein PilQ
MTAQMQTNRKLNLGALLKWCLLFISLSLLFAGQSWGVDNNVMTSLNVDSTAEVAVVKMSTQNPVGYRYTVYDSTDPLRVVIDFPGMDVDSILSLQDVNTPPIESVDVSSFDLTSGKLGRVEIVLSELLDYDVSIDKTDFKLSFASMSANGVTTDEANVVEASSPAQVAEVAAEPEVAVVPVVAAEPEVTTSIEPSTETSAGNRVTGVKVEESSVVLEADGPIEVFKYFTLGAPSRLVLDIYGMKTGFKQRSFDINRDFSKVRVGAYDDKIRFVFDAESSIPEYAIDTQENNLLVSWGVNAESSVSREKATQTGAPANVEAVDFDIEDGMSVLRITLNDSSTVIMPNQKGDVVGFGIKNATISRALRRAVDASSFPSSIRLITPYTVLVGQQQDVRFAVELKGPSEYELVEEGNTILFKVVNGPFAEPDPITTQVAVEVPTSDSDVPAKTAVDKTIVEPDVDLQVTSTEQAPTESQMSSSTSLEAMNNDIVPDELQILGGSEVKAYSGQRISLVFDNAEIRNILQLIAEVSNLNILAGDGVEGTITLRLIDVPWDQALDLILDTKDLGILRDGNVAKILPKEAIRNMDEAKFSAKRTQEKLEDLSTEVIKISYTDLGNITDPVKALLSERGSITEDSRNKQIIVTDIRSNIEKIKALAAILDTPERQVLIEARIVEVNTSANLDLGINWGITYDQNPGGGGNASSALSLGGDFTVAPALGAAGVGSSFSWGQVGVNTTILDLRLGAIETNGEGRVVSNPRIMALNGETATITQGTMIPYTIQTQNGPETEFIEAALALNVTPVINPDNTVILNVKASNSSPGGGGAIDKKEAKTKMLVADGETMVIGGVFVESTNSSESGVPILMDIPLLGNLFRSKSKLKNRSEMMIFITPRILK